MREPLISIIVPVYNVEKYLAKCLDSLINQTYKNIEIICVNDGSTDNSLNILNEYTSDKRIIIINQNNTGLSGARNTGLVNCHGDYIMFVDSDDWIDEDTCEKAYDAVVKYDPDIILWSYIKEYKNRSEPKRIFNFNSRYLNGKESRNKIFRRCIGLSENELAHPEHMDSIVTAWGKLYKSSLIGNTRFVDTKIIATEDALFNIYCLEKMKDAYYIDECKNHYRKDNETSLTSIYKDKLLLQWQCLYDYIEKFLKEKGIYDLYSDALNNRIALGLLGLGLNEITSGKGKKNQIKKIKRIISKPRYRNAYKKLKLKHFPIHWKLFYGCAKYNFATGVYLLLLCIKKIIKTK